MLVSTLVEGSHPPRPGLKIPGKDSYWLPAEHGPSIPFMQALGPSFSASLVLAPNYILFYILSSPSSLLDPFHPRSATLFLTI